VIYNGVEPVTKDYDRAAHAGSFGLGETYPLYGPIAPNRQVWNGGVAPSEGAKFRGSGSVSIGGATITGNQPIEPIDVAVADMNQDGALDIVTLDQASKTVTILHANRANRVRSPVNFSNFDLYEAGDPTFGGT